MTKIDVQTVGLTKRFRDFWGHSRVLAVDHLDLEIPQGEIYGLLGPNGSGKSTTIKMLLGLLFPSSGGASVLGAVPGDVKTNQYIGYLPEESYLYPFLTARETLDFYGQIFGLSSGVRKKRIDSLLEMVGLTGAMRRQVGEFSKGMQRRIGLAQALINDPDLLILDEPTSGMDPVGTRQIKDLIIELGRRGKTILLCSHLLADVEDVCDRIGMLYGGKLRQQGTMDELLVRHNRTEIRVSELSESQRQQIGELLGEGNVEICRPRERLEEFFLRIVEQAQEEQASTSGALMGSQISDFLGEGKERAGADVIGELVKGQGDEREGSGSTKTAAPVPIAEPVRAEVLNDLVQEKTTESTVPVEPVPIEPQPAQEVDENLINDLVGSDDADKQASKNENEPRQP